ncbi:MAG: tetratricopeptide repeat protein [Bryobacteraceae bacterium]
MRLRTAILLLPAIPAMPQAPSNVQTWLNRGTQAFETRQYARAAEAYQTAVALDRGRIEPHLFLGCAWMVQFMFASESRPPENLNFARKAEAEYGEARRLDPRNPTALKALAMVTLDEAQALNGEEKSRKLDDAKARYRQLLSADPRSELANYSLGVIAWRQTYPVLAVARKRLGMRPDAHGPLPDAAMRREIRDRRVAII